MRPADAWLTVVVSNLRSVPTDPDELRAWIEALNDDVTATAPHEGGRVQSSQFDLGAGFDQRNRAIHLPEPPVEPVVLTVTIELLGSTPTIWRRLLLPGDLTLDAVHTLLQAAMGWTDSHLHRFQPGSGQAFSGPYFITEVDEEEGDEGTREEGVRLDQVLCEPGDTLTYLYDFGDGWVHRVTLEAITPLTADNQGPMCLAGARACPPEDVGGVHSHTELADWLRAGARPEEVPEPFESAEHAHGWLPAGYDPDAFDPAETTATMRLWASGEHLPWHSLPEPLAVLVQRLRAEGWAQAVEWLDALGPRVPVALDEGDVRRAARPWLAILDAVGAGTKLTAAGYLPPALVGQVARSSGVDAFWIGRANREDLTWPVLALRENAQALGLLRKAKGTLAPTARARAAAGDPRALVTSVVERMPVGKGFDAEAGWFLLLGLAVGAPLASLGAPLALMLSDRGWRTADGTEIDPRMARQGIRPTLDALESMAGERPDLDEDLLARLARAALFGVEPSR